MGTARAITAAVLAFALSACSDDGPGTPAATAVDADAPPLHSFDIYALGSDTGDELQADVYGITLNPLRAYRLTADKRVSWLSASADTIAVSAADEQLDKLAFLTDGGEMAPWPGLGRPHAFAPEIQDDGTIRYQDNGLGKDIISRYMSYDPATKKSRVLFRDNANLEIAAAGPNNGFLIVNHDLKGDDSVIAIDAQGKRTTYPIAARIESPEFGNRFIAVGVYGSPDIDAGTTGTALVDLNTRKVRIVDGWSELGWTPDRSKLLVTRVLGDAAHPGSELAVLDPSRPDSAPQVLGNVPVSELFMASWVDRSPGT
jgi:hypothetical protein